MSSKSLDRVIRRMELWTLREPIRSQLGPLTAFLVVVAEFEGYVKNDFGWWEMATAEQWSAESHRLLSITNEVALRSNLDAGMQRKLLELRLRHWALAEHYLGSAPLKDYGRSGLQEQFVGALHEAKAVAISRAEDLQSGAALIDAQLHELADKPRDGHRKEPSRKDKGARQAESP